MESQHYLYLLIILYISYYYINEIDWASVGRHSNIKSGSDRNNTCSGHQSSVSFELEITSSLSSQPKPGQSWIQQQTPDNKQQQQVINASDANNSPLHPPGRNVSTYQAHQIYTALILITFSDKTNFFFERLECHNCYADIPPLVCFSCVVGYGGRWWKAETSIGA